MPIENASARAGKQSAPAAPRRSVPTTNVRSSGGSVRTMTDPYRGQQRRTPPEPSERKPEHSD